MHFDPTTTKTWLRLPIHLREGLKRYFVDYIQPGGFLTAFLTNDLSRAIAVGDPDSLAGLASLRDWFLEHAPGHSYGSPQAMEDWLSHRPTEHATGDHTLGGNDVKFKVWVEVERCDDENGTYDNVTEPEEVGVFESYREAAARLSDILDLFTDDPRFQSIDPRLTRQDQLLATADKACRCIQRAIEICEAAKEYGPVEEWVICEHNFRLIKQIIGLASQPLVLTGR